MFCWFLTLICILATLYGTEFAGGHQTNQTWVKYKSKYFIFVNEAMSWMDAQSVCQSIGGFLATVSSAEEKKFIESMTYVSANDVWLGGTDMLAEGRWVWIENLNTISYNYWYSTQPGGGYSENCLLWYNYRNTYYWHDAACSSKYKFVCQRAERKENQKK